MNEEIVKIPEMEKTEYDQLIREEYVARIAFPGEKYPYIAPFIYVFDGNHMYFLSTRYGKKIENFMKNPYVSIEVEKYNPDMSNYAFITLSGRLVEVIDPENRKIIRNAFIQMIKDKNLSKNVMIALGHSSQDPIEMIMSEGRTLIWKLVDINRSTGFKNGT